MVIKQASIKANIKFALIETNSGNLAQVNKVSGGYVKEARFLFWTEDSRLVNVVDDNFYSYYTYGHDGERALKLAGKNSQIDVNAVTYTCQALLDDATLYPSPYLVASRKGYTKHYYAGAERICARIGDGGLDRFGTFQCTDTALSNRAMRLFKDCNSAMLSRQLQTNDGPSVEAVCGKTPIELQEKVKDVPVHVDATVSVDLAFFRQTMKELAYPAQQYSEKSFYYHGDHLGSASWITDGGGIPVQHLQYLPFGEPYVSQHAAGGYEERFTFTAKERDEETGYGYFGARYMDHELTTMWLSIDPMADKYPSISPYAYCNWNPVKLVDPNGMEVDDPPLKFKNIGPVIPKSDFIGWYYGDLEENCNVYAKEQMRVAGYSVGGGADKTNINPYNEKTGSNEAEFNKAVDYIRSSLENGIPVFVGVDDQAGASNPDKTTDHFIVIVGMGYDEEKGNYFTAYDNATPYPKEGTSDQNRLYVDYKNKVIQSDGRFPNNYARNEATRPYTVTQVRQSRKKKK